MNKVLITIICLNNCTTYIFRIEENSIVDEDGITICSNKVIEEANKLFKVKLKDSEISWGIVNDIIVEKDELIHTYLHIKDL